MVVVVVAVVGVVGVVATVFCAWRMLVSVRNGAAREQTLGWMALMLAAGAVTSLLLRAL